jgi:phage terminase small subunit
LSLSTIYQDPEDFLMAVMNDSGSDSKLRVDAAKALMRERTGAGKKEQKHDAAKRAASGKFSAASAPKLIVNNR